MKKIKKVIIFALLLSMLFSLQNYKQFSVDASGNTAEIVMEVNTNRVLSELNSQNKMYMASTTKILTAITIIENCDLSNVVTVDKETTGIEGSSIYLEAGEKLTVKDLLYGLMLRSGNDCAETLAVYCSGSIEDFAILMNETAIKIGAKNSNFVNPHGLHDDNHYTTAYDLALISCYAIKNRDFKEIVSTKSVKIPFTTRGYARHLINKNKMLNDFEGSTGIKTGFTKKAGRCLVTSCFRNGMELVCVVLNCPQMWEKSKELLTSAFTNYKLYRLVDNDNIVDFIPIKNSDKTCGVYVRADVVIPLKKSELENIEIVFNLPDIIENSVKKDQEIGCIKFFSENNLLFEEKIYTIIEVNI